MAYSIVHRYFQLPGAERFALLQALVIVATVRLCLLLWPYGDLHSFVHRYPITANVRSRGGVPSPNRLGWAIRSASTLIPRATCLTQALAGRVLFARYGHPSTVFIGVGKASDGSVYAHAWLSHRGDIVIGQIDEIDSLVPVRDLE